MASVLPSFEELARMPDERIDVALGAALVAKDIYDGLDVPTLLEELATLGEPLEGLAAASLAAREQAARVSERFEALGFRGNTEDYYDPKNSLLPDVLVRRVGIPITLSIVWLALAKRAGIHARGVSFPGHFLVRVDDFRGAPAIVDAFDGGRVLEDDQATALLKRALGESAELHGSLFAPASARAILVRLLTNLEGIWARRGEHARAFMAVDRIVTLMPDSARMLRERAAVAIRIGATELARADLARVLELEPRAPDVVQIEARLAVLRSGVAKTTLH